MQGQKEQSWFDRTKDWLEEVKNIDRSKGDEVTEATLSGLIKWTVATAHERSDSAKMVAQNVADGVALVHKDPADRKQSIQRIMEELEASSKSM